MSSIYGWINPLAFFGGAQPHEDERPTLLKVNSAPIPRPPSKDRSQLDRAPEDPTFGGWPSPDCPTVIHMVMKNGRDLADNPGFLWLDDSLREKQKYTYGEVAEGARAVAHTLTKVNGLKKGDRALLVFIPDGSRDFIIAFFGCLLAGVIAVPVYPPNPASLVQDLERMTKIVEMAGVKVALTTSKFKNLMVVARMKLAFTTGFQYSWPAKLPWQAVDGIGACPPNARPMDEWLVQIRPEDLAFLQFTSGSTGFPKGVMVSHSCLSHNISCQRSYLRRTVEGPVRMCGWLPLYHDFGLIGGVICGSALGATMVGFSPITFLKDPLSWLIVLSKYKVHNTGAPNFALARCVREWNKLSPEKRPHLDLSNLLSLNIGAEPIQERVLRQFASTFAPVGLNPKALNPSYGLAEHVVFLCTSLGVEEDQKVDENGVVVGGNVEFGIDVRIVDHKTLRECPKGIAGEIWVCSPSVAEGYWNLPDLSKEVFRARLDGKEFLRTGDLGYMQEDRLYVTGRLKDVIIVGGANYYPQDIEQTVFDTSDMIRPGRVAAFSLGEGDSELNDRVGLVVEIRDEYMRPEMCQDMFQKITNAVRLQHGLSVSRIKLIKPRSIPRTTSGKIQRQQSKKSLLEGMLEGVPSGEFSIERSRSDYGGLPQLGSRSLNPLPSFTTVSMDTGALSSQSVDVDADIPEDDVTSTNSEEAENILRVLCNACGMPYETVDRSKSLAEMGVGSMQALRIVSDMEANFPYVNVMTLLQPVPLGELVKDIAKGGPGSSSQKRIQPVPIEDVMSGVPLSYGQEQMAILHQLMPESTAYSVPIAVKIKGPLRIDALRQSMRHIIERHYVLSMRFESRNGKLVQVLDESLRRVFDELRPQDIRDVHPGNQAAREDLLSSLLSAEIDMPFDLFKGPAARVMLIQTGEAEHIFMLNAHHAVMDGWSMGVLMTDFCNVYNKLVEKKEMELPPPSIQYHDFAAWQRKTLNRGSLSRLLDYWKSTLKGAPKILELPTDKPRGQLLTTAKAGHVPITIDKQLVTHLQDLASENHATLFMTLLSVFDIVLSRYSGQTDIVVGTPFAGRLQAQMQKIVGYVANPVALRMDMSGNPSFVELLQQSRAVCLSAFEHAAVPIHKVIKALGAADDVSYTPLFQVMFNLQSMEFIAGKIELSGCQVEHIPEFSRPHESRFDLSLELMESAGTVHGVLEYSTDLFQEETIQRIAHHFNNLLNAVVATPQAPLSGIDMLTSVERQSLLKYGREIKHEFSVAEVTLQELFHREADRCPSAPCVVFRGKEMTYQEVEVISNRLAHYLIGLGVGPNKNVGIIADKSTEMVVGILGVLKAGGAYTPIDPCYPVQRVKNIIEDARIQILIVHTAKDVEATLQAVRVHVIRLATDMEKPELAWQSAFFPPNRCSPTNLAYTIFTSGSTGRPKGVMVPHRAVVNFLQWMTCEFRLTSSDRYLQNINFIFDLSMMEIFLPLISGGVLILPDPEFHPDPSYVVDLVNKTWPTFSCSVPSILRGFVEMCQPGDCSSLRTQICCGEVLPTALAKKFCEKLPECTLANTYGPTEATIHMTSYTVNEDPMSKPLSIGRPISNVAVYILDGNMRPCPIGVPGELVISGACLAKGYANRPDLTNEKFIANPFADLSDEEDFLKMYKTGDLACWNIDGSIQICGRIDHQVKVRGFRIELEEVEAAISKIPAVSQAVASVKSDPSDNPHVIAYVVPETVDPTLLKEDLKKFLPHYMIPSFIITMPGLPMLPNGKVNRKSLPAPGWGFGVDEKYVAPRSAFEKKLIKIWEDVLQVKGIGIHSDFFKLGGDSLKAGMVTGKMRLTFGVKVPGVLVFKFRTVAELADSVSDLGTNDLKFVDKGCISEIPGSAQISTSPSPAKYTDQELEEGVPVSYHQARMLALYDCDRSSPSYNIPLSIRLKGQLNKRALKDTMDWLTNRHQILRMRYKNLEDSSWLQVRVPGANAVEIDIMDLTYMADLFNRDVDERARQCLAEETAKPFALYEKPSARAVLLKTGEDEHTFLFCIHHVSFDGVSIGILAKDFANGYNDFCRDSQPTLNDLPIQYHDYAKWQRDMVSSGVLNSQVEYWKSHLEGLPQVLGLPVDFPRGLMSPFSGARNCTFGAFGRVDVCVDPTIVGKLKKIAQDHGATLYMILHATFDLLLSWISGRQEVVVGSPFASGRMHNETENMLGYLVNPLPLRVDVGKHKTFFELLESVRDITMAGFENGVVPIHNIVEAVGASYNKGYHPIYQVVFVLQAGATFHPKVALEGLEVEPLLKLSHVARSKLDLTLELVETDSGVSGGLEFNADLYSEASVQRWVTRWISILEDVSEKPDALLENLASGLFPTRPTLNSPLSGSDISGKSQARSAP